MRKGGPADRMTHEGGRMTAARRPGWRMTDDGRRMPHAPQTQTPTPDTVTTPTPKGSPIHSRACNAGDPDTYDIIYITLCISWDFKEFI